MSHSKRYRKEKKKGNFGSVQGEAEKGKYNPMQNAAVEGDCLSFKYKGTDNLFIIIFTMFSGVQERSSL